MRKTFTCSILLVLAAVLLLGSGCGKLRRGKKSDMLADDVVIGGDLVDEFGDLELSGDRFPGGEPVYGDQYSPVLFAYDSSQIDASERGKIDEVADVMRRDDALNLIVEGHCDERGSREYNMALGEHRALAVRAYLVGLGVEGDRITTKSYGEENPAAYGHDEASWAENRRAAFMLMQ